MVVVVVVIIIIIIIIIIQHFKIKMSDRNFTQRFDVFMTSLSSDNKITVQQCYICGERCDYSLTYLFKQIISRGWNPIACSG